MHRVAIIGGGAAGSIAACTLAEIASGGGYSGEAHRGDGSSVGRMPSESDPPALRIDLYESSASLLKKVSRTGGGKCNITNDFSHVSALGDVYPRGDKFLRKAFRGFSWEDTLAWFERRGVSFVVNHDSGRVFPRSMDAREICDTLVHGMRGVKIHTGHRLVDISRNGEAFSMVFETSGGKIIAQADSVLIATGSPGTELLDVLGRAFGLESSAPVPSLFALRCGDDPIKHLSGTSVEDAVLTLAGSGIRSRGPLLLTDFGVSGPAVLTLSSFAARLLHEHSYEGTLLVNFLGAGTGDALAFLRDAASANPAKRISSVHPEGISSKLWGYILLKARVREGMLWSEAGGRTLDRIAEMLINCPVPITGRSPFKEEFVTCGGVSLKEMDPATMECRTVPGLFLAGEVTDEDGITGGFNLQAAWTMGVLAARGIAGRLSR